MSKLEAQLHNIEFFTIVLLLIMFRTKVSRTMIVPNTSCKAQFLREK
jgi:hypothetical protein